MPKAVRSVLKVARSLFAAALLLALGAAVAPQEAAAHGRRHHDRHYDRPHVTIVPPGHRAHPYWYYGRPQPRRYAPPAFAAPPRHFRMGPHRHYGHHHHRHRRPSVTFEFRF